MKKAKGLRSRRQKHRKHKIHRWHSLTYRIRKGTSGCSEKVRGKPKRECIVVIKNGRLVSCWKWTIKSWSRHQPSTTLVLWSQETRHVKEIKRQIVLAEYAVSKLYNISRNCTPGIKTKIYILNCEDYLMLIYGSEIWSITGVLKILGPPHPLSTAPQFLGIIKNVILY